MCITDITKIKAKDGKLYVSALLGCFDLRVMGLAMESNMKVPHCEQTMENTYRAYPGPKGAIVHSDRGTHIPALLIEN